jgi:predicted dehydrogenase
MDGETLVSIGENRRINAGIAGLGRFGKLHASVLSRFPNVRIAAVCDPIQSERETAATAYGAAAFASLEEMLEGTELDCLFLVTPEQFHGEQARLAIAKGLPTFLEKPLSTTAADGAEIAELARAAGIHLQIGFVLRFETQHAFLKGEIAAGKFGDLVTLRLKRNCSRAWFQIYGDRAHSVHETIIHDIDLAVWLTGSRCKSVYAVERHISGLRYPDACMAILQFENGAICSMETSWLVPERGPANVLTDTWNGTIDAELEVNGTRQAARLRLLESTLQIWTDDYTKHPEAGLWPEVYGQIAGALREEDAHFIHCVTRGTGSTVTSVDDAVEGLRIAEAIMESARIGREVTIAR